MDAALDWSGPVSYTHLVRHHIEGIKIVDEEGNDVTPEKLRQVQREKGLHGRSPVSYTHLGLKILNTWAIQVWNN